MPNEICIICGSETNVDVNTHIDMRYGYVEGAGQCCRECYDKTNKTYDDYATRVMRTRTTLITVSAEDIINTPNDTELGAKIRQRYWELYGEQKPEVNEWICSLCGGDTSQVDYDYLAGTDHISCVLDKEMKQ